MDAAELGFNAWVLIPNVLTTALRSLNVADRDILIRLRETIEPLSPQQILPELAQMSPADRTVLQNTYVDCSRRLGSEAETLLGLPPDAAAEVMAYIENPDSMP